MADFKPNPGSFLPYLEYSKQNRPSTPSAPRGPLALLEILSRQAQQSLPLFDLQTLSGMEPSRYSDALKNLITEGHIEIAGEAPEQVVRLTERGAGVARLARSA